MLSVRVVKSHRGNRSSLIRWVVKVGVLLLSVVITVAVVLHFYSDPLKALTKVSISSRNSRMTTKKSDGSCVSKKSCPLDHFSFFLQSGAGNVIPPKICINNKVVIGTVLNNAGVGLNIVKMNGRTGEILRTEHYDMYSGGEIHALAEFLKNIEMGSVILIASYDEPATKLNDEVRNLISDLGSSVIKSLGFRDSWVFVGGKGPLGKSNFEKHIKNDPSNNKYNNWPELVQMEGCIPKFME